MNEKMGKRDKIILAIFVFISITAGVFGYLLDQVLTEQPEGNSLGMGLWLVLPFLTGIVLRIINKDMKQMGVQPNFKHNLKWYAVAVLVFPGIMLISIIVAKIAGGLIVGEIESSALFVLMVTTFFSNCIKNIFEEFAWRGCLIPYLEKTGMNDWVLYFSSGLIWGMWHIAYYMFFLPDDAKRWDKGILAKMDKKAKEEAGDRPLFITEWNSMAVFASPVHDEKYSAAFAVKSCLDLDGSLDAYMFWCCSDIFEDKGPSYKSE